MLLSEMFQNFYENAEIYNAPGTLRYYRDTYRVLLKRFGDIDSSLITKKMIVSFIKDCQQILSNNTINKRIAFLKSMYRYNELTSDFLTMKKLKEKFVTFGYISESTLIKVYNEVFPFLNLQAKLIIMLLLDTGCRANELVNIKVENIDLENRCILLLKTKTGNPRSVYFSKSTAVVLKNFLKNGSNEFLFYNPKTKSHINVGALESLFARIRKKYNLKNFSPHRLRHTLSTNLYANGGDLLFIMSIMGHTNMNTTKRYIHENKELNLKLYDKFKINIKKSP